MINQAKLNERYIQNYLDTLISKIKKARTNTLINHLVVNYFTSPICLHITDTLDYGIMATIRTPDHTIDNIAVANIQFNQIRPTTLHIRISRLADRRSLQATHTFNLQNLDDIWQQLKHARKVYNQQRGCK